MNALLQFWQGIYNAQYLHHLYSIFEPFCVTAPKMASSFDKRTGTTTQSIYFRTRSHPMFTEFRDLFYPNGVQIVPPIIGELLTARGLAYWAMDDGTKSGGSGFHLCTHSFTLKQVELLCLVLADSFELECSIHQERGKPILYRNKGSMEAIPHTALTPLRRAPSVAGRPAVTPYFNQGFINLPSCHFFRFIRVCYSF